jgi:hypothetical protein
VPPARPVTGSEPAASDRAIGAPCGCRTTGAARGSLQAASPNPFGVPAGAGAGRRPAPSPRPHPSAGPASLGARRFWGGGHPLPCPPPRLHVRRPRWGGHAQRPGDGAGPGSIRMVGDALPAHLRPACLMLLNWCWGLACWPGTSRPERSAGWPRAPCPARHPPVSPRGSLRRSHLARQAFARVRKPGRPAAKDVDGATQKETPI